MADSEQEIPDRERILELVEDAKNSGSWDGEAYGEIHDRPSIVKIEIEFEDGSRRLATGEDAEKWGRWLDGGVGMAVAHGQSPPDVEYDEQPEWESDH